MTAPTTTPKAKPWDRYRKDYSGQGQDRLRFKLLIPGYAGAVDDSELAYIIAKLQSDSSLSRWWGFRPRAKRRPVDAVKLVAMHGDPDNQAHNVRLVRGAPGRGSAGDEGGVSKVTKITQGQHPTDPPPDRNHKGRPRETEYDQAIASMAQQGKGCKVIARELTQKTGAKVSHMTVARRLAEMRR
jgi:hypothetical protein